MSDTTRLGLPLIEAAQAQKHVTHNEALRILDSLVQAVAADRDLSAPPASPQEGVAYIVGPSPSAGWAGHANDLALRVDGVWTFLSPQVGWGVWLVDENRPVYWTGTAWKPLLDAIGTLAHLAGVGIGATPDATNRLSVRSPAALFAAVPAASGGSGDMRLTVEKEAVADTASLLFQTTWSGRAEIGLLGDDDLRIKVSSGGTNWIDAIRIAAATGQVQIGAGGLAGGGRLRSTVVFGASGTWNRPTGVRHVLVYAIGGGGGGGGAGGAPSSGAAGGGGGAGGVAIGFFDVTAISSREVVVGAQGAAGDTSGGSGGTGGVSSFGDEVIASGGAGGVGMAAGTAPASVSGGTGGGSAGGTSAVFFAGAPGGAGLRVDGAVVVAGVGAASFFGGGGRASTTNSASANGTARGSGGSGAAVSASPTSRAGGLGAPGLVWVWEFE